MQRTPGGRLSAVSDSALQILHDPSRIVRWIYMGRLSLAIAIFVAALSRWSQAEASVTLVASLGLALTMAVTAGSALYSEIYHKALSRGFFYLQCVYDLALVTAVVHVTDGSVSQFAALYILVIAYASLVLPSARGLLVAALAIVLYFADVVWGHPGDPTLSVWLQLGVFAIVALGSSYLGGQLHLAGKGRERLVEQLEKARLEAADILRNIRSGIVTVDAGGRLLHANPAADTLLGLSLQSHIGKPVFDVIARVAPELSLALAKCVLEGIRTTRAEGTIDAPDRRFPIGVTTTFTDSGDGAPATATAIFQDISDSKRLEELNLRAERLEAVAELSASLAHEIRNPLASIRSAVEQLSRMSSAGDDEKTLSTLVLRESDRLSRLLGEFLDFARVRVTKIDRVDIGAIARGATELAGKHPDRQEGVRVSCGAPAEPLFIDGDEDLLHRIVFNLALNAVQAAPANGHVRVNVGPISREQMPPEMPFEQGAVALSVADDGPGIAPQIRERLFTPFMTTKPGGSGLGLPVVHRAAEAHQGIVLVDSTPRGTRFTVLLPRTQSGNGTSHG